MKYAIIALSVLFLAGVSMASTTTVNVVITNGQATGTGANFQQMIVFNSMNYNTLVANNMQNIEFTYTNKTVIPSWLESYNNRTHVIYWLLLKNGIKGKGTLRADLVIYPTNTNLMNGATIGEAPELTSPYAKYDNGAKIFTFYSNFVNGSKWSEKGGSKGITFSSSNGLTLNKAINTSCNDANGEIASVGTKISSGNTIEMFGTLGGGAQANWAAGAFSLAVGNNSCGGNNLGGAIDIPSLSQFQHRLCNAGYVNCIDISYPKKLDVLTLATTSNMIYSSMNYSRHFSQTSTSFTNANIIIYLQKQSGSKTTTATWVRERTTPPKNLMPKVKIG